MSFDFSQKIQKFFVKRTWIIFVSKHQNESVWSLSSCLHGTVVSFLSLTLSSAIAAKCLGHLAMGVIFSLLLVVKLELVSIHYYFLSLASLACPSTSPCGTNCIWLFFS